MDIKNSQITDTLLMVRPANFGFNSETAGNNAFQENDQSLSVSEIRDKAIVEFDVFVQKLRDHGVSVIVYEDTETPLKTDAIFPNNWFSTHIDGTMISYPMFSPNRRLERTPEIETLLRENYHFAEFNQNLLKQEEEGVFLEGTGSMILDRINRLAYACYSERTDKALFEQFCRNHNFDPIGFNACDRDGLPIYHTNVIMTLGEQVAVICLESISDQEERQSIASTLQNSGKEIVDISFDQVLGFAGNMLEVIGEDDRRFMVMSEQAHKNLTQSQISLISKYDTILSAPLYTIEKYGGGSARCMLAEIFLEKK